MFAHSTKMGIPEPQTVGWATGMALTLFFYINNKFLMGCIRRFYYEKDNVSFVGHLLVRVVHRL